MPDVRTGRNARASHEVHRLSETLARDPASLVFIRLGDALRREGRLDQARRVAENGVARHPELADAHALLGRVAADAGHLVQAEASWQEVDRLAPGHVDAARGLAFIRWCEGRIPEAQALLEEALAQTSDEATRRSITSALFRLDGAPERRVIAPTPHAGSPSQEPEPSVASGAFVPAPSLVSEALQAVIAEADALGDALQIGRWRALVVECEQGLLGVSLDSGSSASTETSFVVADDLPIGRAVRALLNGSAGEQP